MTDKVLTPELTKKVFGKESSEPQAFFQGGAPKYISNAEHLKARAQSSYLANVIEMNGGKLNSGEFVYEPAGQNIMKNADKELLSSPKISSGKFESHKISDEMAAKIEAIEAQILDDIQYMDGKESRSGKGINPKAFWEQAKKRETRA